MSSHATDLAVYAKSSSSSLGSGALTFFFLVLLTYLLHAWVDGSDTAAEMSNLLDVASVCPLQYSHACNTHFAEFFLRSKSSAKERAGNARCL